MHPLTVIPQLLTFERVAPLLLRVVVALFILFLAREHYKKPRKWVVIFYIVSGVFLILGLYTQIAAILGILVIKYDFWSNKKPLKISSEMILYTMAVVILISLLVTGPGFLAFDLPL